MLFAKVGFSGDQQMANVSGANNGTWSTLVEWAGLKEPLDTDVIPEAELSDWYEVQLVDINLKRKAWGMASLPENCSIFEHHVFDPNVYVPCRDIVRMKKTKVVNPKTDSQLYDVTLASGKEMLVELSEISYCADDKCYSGWQKQSPYKRQNSKVIFVYGYAHGDLASEVKLYHIERMRHLTKAEVAAMRPKLDKFLATNPNAMNFKWLDEISPAARAAADAITDSVVNSSMRDARNLREGFEATFGR